ncbi:MAG: hypothetical protein ACTH8F_08395 [Microbacterium sp.]|uniref:hypothetical protein n=1 Tax=Microbacterium sp. TaxID=51671 RepID=UPI003F9C01E7
MRTEDADRDFSPMLYDVMRELATQLGGRYVEWMREASAASDREHWRGEQFRVTREVRSVDPDSRAAIEAHTATLRAELAAMPRHAPVLA